MPPINATLTANLYNLTIQDDTAARVTPDGGIEVRRTTRPRRNKYSYYAAAKNRMSKGIKIVLL